MGISGRWLRDRRKGSERDFAISIYIYFGVAMAIERNLVVVLYRKSFLSLFFLRRYGILGAWACVFKSSERVLNL